MWAESDAWSHDSALIGLTALRSAHLGDRQIRSYPRPAPRSGISVAEGRVRGLFLFAARLRRATRQVLTQIWPTDPGRIQA